MEKRNMLAPKLRGESCAAGSKREKRGKQTGSATYLLDMGIQAAAQCLRVGPIAGESRCDRRRNGRKRRDGRCDAAIAIGSGRVHDAVVARKTKGAKGEWDN